MSEEASDLMHDIYKLAIAGARNINSHNTPGIFVHRAVQSPDQLCQTRPRYNYQVDRRIGIVVRIKS